MCVVAQEHLVVHHRCAYPLSGLLEALGARRQVGQVRLDRFRLRGLSGVRDEVLLTATAQNLMRLVKFLCRAPPAATVCPA